MLLELARASLRARGGMAGRIHPKSPSGLCFSLDMRGSGGLAYRQPLLLHYCDNDTVRGFVMFEKAIGMWTSKLMVVLTARSSIVMYGDPDLFLHHFL